MVFRGDSRFCGRVSIVVVYCSDVNGKIGGVKVDRRGWNFGYIFF